MQDFKRILILFLPALLLISESAGAQDYVLTIRGDSLKGEVRPLLYGAEQKVQLISDDKEKTTFSLFEVREFSQEGNIFRPLKGENGYVFMKLLHPGYLSLYAYQLENQSRFDGLMLRKLDGDQLVVPNLGFKKYVGQFLKDCPDIAARIKEGELGKRNLPELITAYNACVNSRTANREEIIEVQQQEDEMIDAWESLEQKVREKTFDQRSDALEMIAEIKNKIHDHEKIPNFLTEGLRNALSGTGLSDELDTAIRETNENAGR